MTTKRNAETLAEYEVWQLLVMYGFGHALRITGDGVRECMHYELDILEEFPVYQGYGLSDHLLKSDPSIQLMRV